MKLFSNIRSSLHEVAGYAKFYRQFTNVGVQDRMFLQDIINEINIKRYFLRYNCVANTVDKEIQKSSNGNDIWQLWYQGFDEAPPLVKKCFQSVKEFNADKNIIVITEKNIENYIAIPGYIYDKKKKGIISNVNFSDLLRAFLLAEHGGTWLDATIMLTDRIPEFIFNSPLFCFSTTPREYRGVGNILASSWFIHSAPHHVILESLRNSFTEYWKFENTNRHHYYFHLLFANVCSHDNCKQEWERVPFFSNVPPQILQMELFNHFDEVRFEQIKQMSFIHKLTFYGGEEFDTEKKETFYDFLINKR